MIHLDGLEYIRLRAYDQAKLKEEPPLLLSWT